MKHKLLRGLVALVLVCVLVVSWSPIRAWAVPVVGWDGFAWNLSEIIASGAIGIGTSPGAVPDDWNNMIENAKQACQDFFGLVGDTMKIYRFFDGSSYKYYAKADFVEWLREWMWYDSGVFKTADSALDESFIPAFNEYILMYCDSFGVSSVYCYYYSSGNGSKFLISGVPWSWEANNNRFKAPSGMYGYALTYNGSSLVKSDGVCSVFNVAAGSKIYSFHGNAFEFGTEYDGSILVGKFEPPDKLLGDAYPEWVQNSVYIPAEVAGTEDEVLALPLGLGQTLTETQGLTQEQIWAGESTLEVEIEEALEGTVSGTLWADFTTWFGQKLEWIPKQILEGITAIFVPKEDFLTAKWEAIRAEFAFADSIMSSGDMVLDVLNGIDPEPPVIYIDLGASEGSYDIGGEVPFLDLRWYERYKPTGDAIISAFLWLVFAWRMFIKLPGIIGGLPGDFVMQGVVNLGLSEHLPARKKEYEYERQQNRRSMKK